MLRRALASTVQYEADSLLADLSLGGHRITFVSLSEPLGAPTPLEVGKDYRMKCWLASWEVPAWNLIWNIPLVPLAHCH